MLIYNGQIIAGGGTIVLPMTRAEYEANKAVLDTADVWVDLTDEADQVASADEIAYWVGQTQKGMGYIGDIATKAIAKVEPTDTALYLHAVGTYFINKDGNTCVTDVQIPVGGTITLGTNCHVCSDGVANNINSNLLYQIPDIDYTPVGTMTNSQMFDNLFALIDTSKLTPKTKLVVNANQIYTITYANPTLIQFVIHICNSTNNSIGMIALQSSGSRIVYSSINNNNTCTYSDVSSWTGSGNYKIYY